ncbi:GAF domain-containing protein [Luteolibacter soli]|uniref:histidine kinase n=1 Tax=Luteolibacter soli TaxID=3135280 RepID=A0ABU9AWY7_9BACT
MSSAPKSPELTPSALVTSRRSIAADLEDTRLLQELGARLVDEDNIDAIYQEILAAAITLTRAAAGVVQILDPRSGGLSVLSAKGFDEALVIRFRRVDANSPTSCGLALTSNKRAFVDFDGPGEPNPALKLLLEAGFRSAQSTPLVSRAGNLIGMITTHWTKHHRPADRELRFLDLLARQAADLIERRSSEEALQTSERRYRTLFDSIDEGFCTIEVIFNEAGHPIDYRFLQVNPSFVRLTGINDAVGRTMREITTDHEPHWFETYGRIVKTGEPERFVARAQQLQRWYDVYASRVDEPELHHVAVLFNDVTHRVHTEEELRHARDALESRVKERTLELASALKRVQDEVDERKKIERERRELLQRIVHLQEAERTRVARELHDNLGQHMVAVLMHVEGFQRKLLQAGNKEASNDLEEFRKVVDGLIRATHRQSWELRPAELDELGLEVALENYVHQWSEKTSTPVDFHATDRETRDMHPEQVIALYRVTQEALTNVARHAHATHVSVELEVGRSVCVSIRDNGVGFDPATVKRRLGLLGMQERLDIVGGTLVIDASPNHGTRIQACVPHVG